VFTSHHITPHHITSHDTSIRYDPRVVSDLDLPADLFRAQLVCEALNTCGAYYVRGQAKERLSRYLVYFQRYLLSKPLLPTHIEFAILDTFDNLEELARSAAIASAVKLKSAAPALKVIKSHSYLLAVFFNSCYPLFLFIFSPFFHQF
jgi:MIF4G domain